MGEKAYKPIFFRVNTPVEIEEFHKFKKLNNDITVFDTLHAQLLELIKNRNPQTTFNETLCAERINIHLNGTPPEEYGVWVYYTWSKRLVHLLDETEFVELRTARNHYKITHEEEQILGSKKICIIGLSVGQSVALTLAMERICGELHLADYDTLDLSNLNRLRAGVHEIGMPKTIICAREIAEIDPFLKVVLYDEGINGNNIDSFLNAGGKAHLLIEECDSLEVKVLSRLKARQFGIPVIMETNDRGMVDIERFDLEPDRQIFHGLIGDINISDITEISGEKRMNLLLAIVGAETLSDRMKISIKEMKRSITGWPQLASAVVMGGGIITEISRKILLNQHKLSGRYYIDLEELIR